MSTGINLTVNVRSPILKLLKISSLVMSKKQYLKNLNAELQKLNGIIDNKITYQSDYRKEARRHKELLRQLRKEERGRSIFSALSFSFFSRI